MKGTTHLLLAVLCLAPVTATIAVEGVASPATLAGPVTWGNPDHSWGMRRPVTEADRARIAHYRATKPGFEETFAKPEELTSWWALQSDDNPGLKSCRRPENVVITSHELQLRTLDATDCHAKWSTGSMISKARYPFGFFEARMKIANITGINNAFWLVTDDHFEIDIAEVHYPSEVRMTLHNNNDWAAEKNDAMHAVGFDSKFIENLSDDYHDYGVLWTPTDIIFEVDGNPVAAISTKGAIKGSADIRFSTAVTEFGGKIPSNPVGRFMYVRSLRVSSL
jgi:hypothetical protein